MDSLTSLSRLVFVALALLACSGATPDAPDASRADASRADALSDAASDLADAACAPACGAGAWCENNRCVCSSPQTYCPPLGCVDTTVDPAHCGGCLTHCAPGLACRDGVCNAPCPTANHRCADGCFSDLDVTHCGAACERCVPPAHASSRCVLNACSYACEAGWHACTGGCFTDDDPAHCGARCAPCPDPLRGTARCIDGACLPQCDPGSHACDGRCAPDDAVSTCGTRCDPCPTPEHASPVCASGACDFTCATGFRRCGDICSDGTSPLGCGLACVRCEAPEHSSARCVSGACDFACDAGFHRCGARCTADLSPLSCGARCEPCPAPEHAAAICTGGACDFECNAGFVRIADACASVPRLLYPPSTARLTGRHPTLRWSLPDGVSRVTLSLCRDRACASVLATRSLASDHFALDEDLPGSVLFWRVAVEGTTRASPTWFVRIPRFSRGVTVPSGLTLDADGDGYADLAVGAPLASSGSRVFLYRGGARGIDASMSAVLIAPNRDGNFGLAVQSAGDLDGDGYSELAVGAPLDAMGAGRVYIYRGGPHGLAEVYSVMLTGSDGAAAFYGTSITPLGDLDGDGYADLAVGAYGARSGVGRVHIYFGSPAPLDLSRETVIEAPEATNGRFGYALATLGDIDADGDCDLAVGADGVMGYTGRVYVYSARSGTFTAAPTQTLSAPTGSRFGAALAGCGDTDGDGFPDLLVGSLGELVAVGRAYVFTGAASGIHTAPAVTLTGVDGERAAFGTTVASAGDLDGDGYDDVAVGAPQAHDFAGSASLYRGGATGLSAAPFLTLRGTDTAGAYYGGALASGRDLDGDGADEIAIGAERAVSFSGYVELISVVGGAPTARVLSGPDGGSGRFGFALASRETYCANRRVQRIN